MVRPRGSGHFHNPKKVSFNIEKSDYEAAKASGVNLSAIFRRGLEVCLITGRVREDVIYQLMLADISRAEELEHKAAAIRLRVEEIKMRVDKRNDSKDRV
jgi:hypothetical protein